MNLERANWGGPTIADALREGLAAVGYGVADADLPVGAGLEFPSATKLCFVLVDGLGAYQLRDRIGHAPNLRQAGIERDISAVVPSTTAAGITAVGTGLMPGRTSMAGYSMRSPLTGNPFSLIAWAEPGLEAHEWQSEPTLFERLGERAKRCVLVQPKKFINSGLTNAALRGACVVPAELLSHRVDAAARELRSDADVCYLYWGDIDSYGHKFGWNSNEWIAELEHFDYEFGRLLATLPTDTLVVLTADHGMIDVDERIDVAGIPQLSAGVELVAGEPRAVQLYTQEGQQVASRWRDYFGNSVWLYTKPELIESALLGPVDPRTEARLGDVIVFAQERRVIVDSRVQSQTAIDLIGVHGSLTNQEMRVPLITVLT